MWCLYLVQLMLHQIKTPQFYTDLGLQRQFWMLQSCADLRFFFRGWSRSEGHKTVWTTFYLVFFLALNLIYRGGPIVLLQRKLYFSKDLEGVQHFPGGGGGPTFSRGGGGGVQMLISIETHITCDFPGWGGGSRPLSPPLDSHMPVNGKIQGLFSVFPVLFNANLIFKDFSSLCEPWLSNQTALNSQMHWNTPHI